MVHEARPRVWPLVPLENVGPLRFGMSLDEAAAAVPDAVELRRFQADPWHAEIIGVELGCDATGAAFYEYFDKSGQLFCVAADAVRGPRVTWDGVELTGGDPAELEQWLAELPTAWGGLRFGPMGNPGINELGLVLRVQPSTDRLVTRPVLVGRDWSDRCTDDSEGRIPTCEWLGHLWPHPFLDELGIANVSPPSADSPRWPGGWSPPF